VKLEGAEKVGYQSVVIGSIRDPFIIRQIGDWVARVYERVHARVADVYAEALSRDDYVFYSTVVICHARVSMLPLNPAEYAE
jgi:hypothetical protein